MRLYQIPNEVVVILNDHIILTITNTHKPFDSQNKTGGYTITAPYRFFGNFPDVNSVNNALDALENNDETKKFFGLNNPEPKYRTYDETWSNPEKLLEFIKTLENTEPTGMAHSLSICSELHLAKKRLKELE
jgi:hypothetical protein